MVTARRFGSETAASRAVLLDTAAQLMVRDGYPAVTSRRVAAEAGMKPALVHYYFRTMDDLFVAMLRRLADQGLSVQEKALASSQPLWALWDLSRSHEGTALTMELVALANHRKAIRAEMADVVARFKVAELRVITEALERHGIAPADLPPGVAAMLMSSVARFLASEASLGMFDGHKETVAFVERYIAMLEGERSG